MVGPHPCRLLGLLVARGYEFLVAVGGRNGEADNLDGIGLLLLPPAEKKFRPSAAVAHTDSC
jgi:hypothetical protein